MKNNIILMINLFFSCCFAEPIALTFKNGLCKAELCLHGTFKKGEAVTLLSKDSERVCTALTQGPFSAGDEMLNFPATKLSKLKGCEESPNLFLGVFERKVKYSIPKTEQLNSDELHSLDKKVKSSLAFMDLYKNAQIKNYGEKNGDSYPNFDFEQLKRAVPIGARYQFSNAKTIELIWHRIENSDSEGAIFGIYKNKVSLVSGFFNRRAPFVFFLNSKIHILVTRSCQLGCGESTSEIYEFSDDGAEKIYSNSDFST